MVMLVLIVTLFVDLLIAQESFEKPLCLKISKVRMAENSRTILLKAKLTNRSKVNVVVDETLISYEVNFRTDDKTFTELGEIGPGYLGKYIILGPNESITVNRPINLTDTFFCCEKRYRLSLKYGQFVQTRYSGIEVWRGTVRSNEIIFDGLKSK